MVNVAVEGLASIEILTPFLSMTKADIVRLGAELHVPFERTWSCYKGGALHCGTCGTCFERREAFALARRGGSDGVRERVPTLAHGVATLSEIPATSKTHWSARRQCRECRINQPLTHRSTDMNTTEILLNIDLAAGTTALVALAMIAVPNLDRIRAFRRALTRRRVWRAHEQRLVAGGLIRS